MDIRQTNCPLRHKVGTWSLGGKTLKSLEKLSNGLTDWHQLWFTSADSSGSGHRLNTSRPTIPQGAFGGGLGVHKFKCLGKLSNSSTDWHQLLVHVCGFVREWTYRIRRNYRTAHLHNYGQKTPQLPNPGP